VTKQSIPDRRSAKQREEQRGGGETRVVSIESFTTPGLFYSVSLDVPRSCSCPHNRKTGARCRHLLVAGVIERIRRSPFGTRHDEEVAREIVARVLDRKNRLDASYDALVEVRYYSFATRELRSVAKERHQENIRRELAKVERGVA
jgi:hypothetical protein